MKIDKIALETDTKKDNGIAENMRKDIVKRL